MEEQLKALIVERGQIKACLTRFKKFCDTSASTTPIDSLRKRVSFNQDLMHKFDAVQSKIEIILEGHPDAIQHERERDQFETTYFDLMAAVEKYYENTPASRNPVASSTPTIIACSQESNPGLPTIKLPEFDGSYNQWVRFRDTFESLIHMNNQLSDIKRFHYLNSSLKGEAAKLIESLGITEANYAIAWKTIKDSYERPREIIRHHVKSLIHLPNLSKQCSQSLKSFIVSIRNHLHALESLNEPVKQWDTLIIFLMAEKLDLATRKAWERHLFTLRDKPTIEDFTEFVEIQSRLIERVATVAPSNRPESHSKPKESARIRSKIESVTAHITNSTINCASCKGKHFLWQCDEFRNLSHLQKHDRVKELLCCFNCLQTGHSVKNCTRSTCRKCGKKHHTLLHRNEQGVNASSLPTPRNTEIANPVQLCVANLAQEPHQYSVLSTALVTIRDSHGKLHKCRAILDSGSQSHFIREDLCQKFGLTKIPIKHAVGGLGLSSNVITSKVQITLESTHNNFTSDITCLAIKNITEDMPNLPINLSTVPRPSHITLADPEFYKSGKIDLLIGSGLFWKLLCIGQHNAGIGDLVWQKTQLGWVLGGQMTWPINYMTTGNTCHLVSLEQLRDEVAKFWEIEQVETTTPKLTNLNVCEEQFRDTIKRDKSGRYIVSIPFTEKINKLGLSRDQAQRRFYSIERRLAKNSKLRSEYTKFMREYETLGHMTLIGDANQVTDNNSQFFLPHHAVVREDSSTTKVRVVFDGSAKSSSGISLNDAQHVGPIVQDDLFSILLRFRMHKIVLTADIEKMYRQILVNPDNRKYQRILWRADVNSPLQTYELNTVTYGTASAPFLATRVLKQVGMDSSNRFPLASRAIMQDFYVDDLLTGTDSIEEAYALKQELTDCLERAGMNLRKWATNANAVIEKTPSKDINVSLTPAETNSKILGMHWDTAFDKLHFLTCIEEGTRVTKRQILSAIAKIFDPLGLIGPIIVRAKMMMQELWQLRVGWDESVSQDLHSRWTAFLKDLRNLSSIQVPRRITNTGVGQVEIHGFSDASEKAYGACIYLRTRDSSEKWTTRLLCAKSRIAPLKQISLPRLELCGALLLAQLLERIRNALKLTIKSEHCWSDSTITLAWIGSPPSRWKTFVANRVNEIQELSKGAQWHHVASADNPADLISRGTSPTALNSSRLWWSGPSWLEQAERFWPTTKTRATTIPEEREPTVLMATSPVESEIFHRYSIYTQLIRITAYCLKFIDKVRSKLIKENNTENLSDNAQSANDAHGHLLQVADCKRAELVLIKLAQHEHLLNEIQALKKGCSLNKGSKLISLNPFLDSKGIIRVGGRLANAEIPVDQKHPIVLPAKHPLTILLIRHEHIRLLHAGPQQTKAMIRTRFWPLACSTTVKSTLRQCIKCFRTNPPTKNQYLMGNLPTSRVTPERPFHICGVDYAGPFLIKERGRGKISWKAYLCIFVCFATKAVHIELASDLSTDAFLACLQRFISRRGKCKSIHSDNGTNFVGTKNELQAIGALLQNKQHNDRVSKFLCTKGIDWHLIPPHSPHFGGLWESAVKSAKYHLKRVIGEQRLTYDELYTILVQVEACLNSRPLLPLSSDPNDLLPLTPGHFLIGDALTALPQPDWTHLKPNQLNRYQLMQQTIQSFWKRWSKEYLNQLQQRNKWHVQQGKKPEIGNLVVIREDNLPPLRWRLGKITATHPGSDNIVRVVTVKVSDGYVKRPVAKLCLLPQQDNCT